MMSQLPREILENAIALRNSVRQIYIALYNSGKPSTSKEIAAIIGKNRAYVNMRLQELVDLGRATVDVKGKTKYFEVIKSEVKPA